MSRKTVAGVVAVVAVAGLAAALKLNRVQGELAAQRRDISGAWAKVDAALTRRANLVPGLIDTVQGLAAEARSAVEAVAHARTALTSARGPAERIAANARLDTALARVQVLADIHPKLQASERFRRLYYELLEAERGIEQERPRYNEKVQRYNTSIALFPNNLAAGLFNLPRDDAYFRTEPAARAVPKATQGEPR